MTQYKKGDLVKVYSLQSFFYGGFLNGDFAVVSQDQAGGSSVLVTVCRNFNMYYKLDFSYEVYEKQLEPIIFFNELEKKDMEKLGKMLLKKDEYNRLCDLDNEDFQLKYKKLMLKLSKKYDKREIL